ncbi:MAG: glycolate oxidase subunit GlcE [Ahrensia sp.]|nr:glycolate oxidase subunit GlcE [Ahrensia sp.]
MRLEPKCESEACEAVRKAVENRQSLRIMGGGTRSTIGAPVVADVELSSRALTGIVDYEPAEMVMIARAGTPMSEIDAALETGRQRLIFEPLDHRALLGSQGEPTIGGVVATNASGPRRFVAGACRDALLGARFVNGEGEAIKAGGRVMKNVTGLDLVKPLCGSWGTLALLTEVTLKVVPLVEAEATLVLHGLSAGQAAEAMAAAMATSLEVSGAAHLPQTIAATVDGLDGACTLLRLEGFASSVDARCEKLKSALRSFGELSTLPPYASRAVWQSVRNVTPFADSESDPVWRISMAPSRAHEMIAALNEGDALFDWQGGLVWLRLAGDAQVEKVRRLVAQHGGGHATLIRADDDLRASVPVFHPQAAPIAALSERIARAFDPNNIFNPGLMG